MRALGLAEGEASYVTGQLEQQAKASQDGAEPPVQFRFVERGLKMFSQLVGKWVRRVQPGSRPTSLRRLLNVASQPRGMGGMYPLG